MSKHPSARMDQLRALREAKYARKNEQPGPQPVAAEAPAEPVKPAPKKAKAKKKAAAKR
jgi:hypothetical protein